MLITKYIMDPIFILLDKIDNLINENVDVNKIENIITSDVYYNKLDMDEQMIINETLKEKIDLIKDRLSKGIPAVELTEGEQMSSRTTAVVLEKISDTEFNRRSDIFNKIREIELPEQRSAEWFAMRNGKITASDGGTVLGLNKHEPQFNFILKKVLGSTFETNDACYHGKKFENAVTLMYELSNNTHTEEFGLLGHPEHYFLGASPDGICSPYCRDKVTLNRLVGRMLEIKCPLMRKIKYTGDIVDNICPIYYWCQVQLQLECCDLDECDFIQCNIEEYSNRKEWLNDTSSECDYKSTKYGLERGVIIETLPAKLNENEYEGSNINKNTVYDKAIAIYPPKIDMTNNEIDNWVLDEISKLETTHHLRLNRVIYWRLKERNCTLIKRDRGWFQNNFEKLKTMWGYVEYLRENNDVIIEWKAWIETLNKKYNDKIMNKLQELIDKKKKSKLNINEQIEKLSLNAENNNDYQEEIVINNGEPILSKKTRKYVKKPQTSKTKI